MNDFSKKLRDLHIYLIPKTLWLTNCNTADSNIIRKTVSAGFLRIEKGLSLKKLREYINEQLVNVKLPKEFIFCKNVGRSLACLHNIQESLMDCEIFFPTESEFPEVFLLDREVYNHGVLLGSPVPGDGVTYSTLSETSTTIHRETISTKIHRDENSKQCSNSSKRPELKVGFQNRRDSRSISLGPLTASINRFPSKRNSSANSLATTSLPALTDELPSSRKILTNSSSVNRHNPSMPSIPESESEKKSVQMRRQSSSTREGQRGGLTGRRRSSILPFKDSRLAEISLDIDMKKEELLQLEREQRKRMVALQTASETTNQDALNGIKVLQLQLEEQTAALEIYRRLLMKARQQWAQRMAEQEAELDEAKYRLSELLRDDDLAALSASNGDEERRRLEEELQSMQERLNSMLTDWERKEEELIHQRDEALAKQANIRHILTKEMGVNVKLQSPEPKHVEIEVAIEKNDEDEKNFLARLRVQRFLLERRKLELIRRVRHLSSEQMYYRNQARDAWRRKFYAAKKKTPDLANQLKQIQQNIDTTMRRESNFAKHSEFPYIKEGLELKHQVLLEERWMSKSLLKLSSAVKLRNQTESELRVLLAEVKFRRGSENAFEKNSNSRIQSARLSFLDNESMRYFEEVNEPEKMSLQVPASSSPKVDNTSNPPSNPRSNPPSVERVEEQNHPSKLEV